MKFGYDIIIKSNLNDYLKNYKNLFYWDNRLLDLNTERYDKNIAFTMTVCHI